jgi:peptidoglycan hydrolase CwlO-like protein
VKKVVIAIAIVLLILMNTIAYLLIYKKYNDIIDCFNQDSQLTSERLIGFDARIKELGAKVEEAVSQFDNKTGAAKEQIAAAFAEMRKDIYSRLGSLERDVEMIKQKNDAKMQLPKR